MKKPIKCILNNREVETAVNPGTAALDFIRQHQKLTGTKEGCKEGECGACTVLIGELNGKNVTYKAVASCLLPLGELDGKHIVTVEGLSSGALTPVQEALTIEGASQCGFCTPGIVVSLTGFFLASESLDYRDAVDALDGNICRCTGYVSIQRAARNLCRTFAPKLEKKKQRLDQLVEWSILPGYFLQIPRWLVTFAQPNLLERQTLSREGSKRVIVAGATDLCVQRPEELLEKNLEFLSQYSDLKGIRQENNWLFIGAGTTIEEMKLSPLINRLFPGMKDYLNLVASTIMRSRATAAGNIVNASPIGDLTIILLALNADICLAKSNKRRELPLKDFFKGYKKLDLKKNEIIESIEIPIPQPVRDFRFHFEKVSQRKYLDIASCNTAIYIRVDGNYISDLHLSAGGVAPVPLYLEETCGYLRGKEITYKTFREAMEVMEQEISPISDVRGTAQYKTLLLRNLIIAHFITLYPEKKLEEVLV